MQPPKPNDPDRRLRRVGRLSRRRMRIDGDLLRDGTFTDGTLEVQITGFRAPAAGVPERFSWRSSRPIALVVVRSGIDGGELSFQVGPADAGESDGAPAGDGTGIRYVAFSYDAPPSEPSLPVSLLDPALAGAMPARPTRLAAAVGPTRRGRRSILAPLLRTGSPA
jgi:hypothetical protein